LTAAATERPAFSASDAAIEGFHFIRRHWRVVVGWGIFNLLAWIAMVIVTAVASLIAMAAGGGAEASQTAAAVVGGVVSALGVLLIGAILACGVYRVMLRPDEPAFLHLRVGPDELRNLAVGLIVALGALLLATALGSASQALGGGIWVRVLLGAAALAVGLAILLRFLLVAPWTFVERRFAIAAPFRASRGRIWALLGMVVLNACLMGLVAVTLWLAMFFVTGFATGFDGVLGGMTDAEAMEAHPGRTLLQFAVQILLWPVFTVLATAPLAAAYRALRPD